MGAKISKKQEHRRALVRSVDRLCRIVGRRGYFALAPFHNYEMGHLRVLFRQIESIAYMDYENSDKHLKEAQDYFRNRYK